MSRFTTHLGLGTNLGDRSANLNIAVELISERIGEVLNVSCVYKTAAWGVTNQPDFYNQVIEVKTNLFPWELMKSLLDIEQIMGRVRIEKWHERLIDIDILFFENVILFSDDLKIPHPYLKERMFVLKPLQDLGTVFLHPVFQKTVTQLIQECNDSTAIALS